MKIFIGNKWIISAPVILSVTRDQWKQNSELRRNIAKASAMANEKDVILARIDDLPAWVCRIIDNNFYSLLIRLLINLIF